MTEEPTDADGAPTATARRDATHNAKSTRHLAHSRAGKMALDWRLLAWRCVIARWWLLQAVLSRRDAAVSAARAAAGCIEVAEPQRKYQPGARGGHETRLKCRHFSARQTSDRTTDVTGPCNQEERPCRLLPPQAPELPVTRTAERSRRARDYFVDARSQWGPSVLYFSLTLAPVHMRETRHGRGDSRIRQRRLSSACTQCLRPLLVLLSAAATHSSNVHSTWENRYVAAMISCRTERGLQL